MKINLNYTNITGNFYCTSLLLWPVECSTQNFTKRSVALPKGLGLEVCFCMSCHLLCTVMWVTWTTSFGREGDPARQQLHFFFPPPVLLSVGLQLVMPAAAFAVFHHSWSISSHCIIIVVLLPWIFQSSAFPTDAYKSVQPVWSKFNAQHLVTEMLCCDWCDIKCANNPRRRNLHLRCLTVAASVGNEKHSYTCLFCQHFTFHALCFSKRLFVVPEGQHNFLTPYCMNSYFLVKKKNLTFA